MPQYHELIRWLQQAGLCHGAVSVEALPGGITNENFRVGCDSGVFVARICKELPMLGIDRRSEAGCQAAAWRLGLAPEPLSQEPGLLVSTYVPGRTLSTADLQCEHRIARLATALRTLHDGWEAVAGHLQYFCPFQTIRTYAATATSLGVSLPAGTAGHIEDSGRLARRIGPFRPVLCHNDLLPANLIESGDRIWLIDWEYGGMGHPLFDLASVSANASFTDDRDVDLLRAYRGEIRPLDLDELRVFKIASSLREALWALIQTRTSSFAFDYHDYAARNLETYHLARSRLPA